MEENTCPMSNSEAAHMFEKYLFWLEHQDEAKAYNTCTLLDLHSPAVCKRVQWLKQKTIPEMLNLATKQEKLKDTTQSNLQTQDT